MHGSITSEAERGCRCRLSAATEQCLVNDGTRLRVTDAGGTLSADLSTLAAPTTLNLQARVDVIQDAGDDVRLFSDDDMTLRSKDDIELDAGGDSSIVLLTNQGRVSITGKEKNPPRSQGRFHRYDPNEREYLGFIAHRCGNSRIRRRIEVSL